MNSYINKAYSFDTFVDRICKKLNTIESKIKGDSNRDWTVAVFEILSELKSKEIVECINEEARKGRLYRLTDTGKEVLESINEKEEEN